MYYSAHSNGIDYQFKLAPFNQKLIHQIAVNCIDNFFGSTISFSDYNINLDPINNQLTINFYSQAASILEEKATVTNLDVFLDSLSTDFQKNNLKII